MGSPFPSLYFYLLTEGMYLHAQLDLHDRGACTGLEAFQNGSYALENRQAKWLKKGGTFLAG